MEVDSGAFLVSVEVGVVSGALEVDVGSSTGLLVG